MTSTRYLLVLSALAVQACYLHPTPPARRNDIRALQNVNLLIACEEEYRSKFGRFADMKQLRQFRPHLDIDDGSLSGFTMAIAVHPDSFEIRAVPQIPGVSGYKTYYANETGIVRFSYDQTKHADATSKVVEYSRGYCPESK